MQTLKQVKTESTTSYKGEEQVNKGLKYQMWMKKHQNVDENFKTAKIQPYDMLI